MIDPTRLLPVSAQVHLTSLRTLAAVWAARRTGTVRSPACSPVILVAGDATTHDAPDRLTAALCMPGLTFEPGEVEHEGLNVPLGGLLVEAARLVSNPRAIRRRTRVLISEGEHFMRARHRLPLPSVTNALLTQVLRSGLTLEDALRAEGVGAGVIADDLAALVALEFLRIEKVPRSPGEDSVTSPTSIPAVERVLPDPAQAITRRLEREWALFEDADDWAVLGLRSKLPKPQINAAAARMMNRYRGLAERQDIPEEAQAIGRKLLERVQNAAERLASGAARATLVKGASGQQAVRMGWMAIDELDFEEARRWFQRGRKDARTAPVSMAGQGWVEIIDSSSPPDAKADGLELLRLAAGVEPGDARVQWLLAEAERIMGASEGAEAE